jgi:hypothetical protein
MSDEYSEIEYYQAMQNAYILLTNKLTFNEVFEHNGCDLPFDVSAEVTKREVNEVINFFCEQEEYEKCSELKKAKELEEYGKNFINL